MKKDSCLAYWGSTYLTEFLHKTNGLHNGIGVPQKCFGRCKSTWQTRRNVYANGSRDCTSNSSAYPNIHTEGRAALEQKEVKKMSQRKDQKAQGSCNKSSPQPLYSNSLLCASKGTVPPEGPWALVTSPFFFPDSHQLLFKCSRAEGRAWRTLTFSVSC